MRVEDGVRLDSYLYVESCCPFLTLFWAIAEELRCSLFFRDWKRSDSGTGITSFPISKP